MLIDLQDRSHLDPQSCLVAVAHGQAVLTAPEEAFFARVDWSGDEPSGWRPHEDPGSPVRVSPLVRSGVPRGRRHRHRGHPRRTRRRRIRSYVDADVPGLGKILAGLRSDVTYPGDPGAVIRKRERAPCPAARPGVPGTGWIPQVAARGWLIITRDAMITQNRSEITAVREHNDKTAALNQRDAQTKLGPARSLHDPVAPHRSTLEPARPVHLAHLTHRHDPDRARLTCTINRPPQLSGQRWRQHNMTPREH